MIFHRTSYFMNTHNSFIQYKMHYKNTFELHISDNKQDNIHTIVNSNGCIYAFVRHYIDLTTDCQMPQNL